MLRRFENEYNWSDFKELAQKTGRNLYYYEFNDSYYVYFVIGGYIQSCTIVKDTADATDFETNYKSLCNLEEIEKIIEYKFTNVDLTNGWEQLITLLFDFDMYNVFMAVDKNKKYHISLKYVVDNMEFDILDLKEKITENVIILGNEQDDNVLLKRGNQFKIKIDSINATANIVISFRRIL